MHYLIDHQSHWISVVSDSIVKTKTCSTKLQIKYIQYYTSQLICVLSKTKQKSKELVLIHTRYQ